jgi:hypothetical protein
MTVLDTRVQQRLPVAVVALSGGLDEATVGQAEAALWECLAQMPNAMIIDAAGLDIEPAGWRWFADLRHRAARWPGGALCLAGFQGPLEEPAFDHFPSVPLALAAQPSDPHERRRDLVLPPHPRSCCYRQKINITRLNYHEKINEEHQEQPHSKKYNKLILRKDKTLSANQNFE